MTAELGYFSQKGLEDLQGDAAEGWCARRDHIQAVISTQEGRQTSREAVAIQEGI
jgi:hypothetical protein